MAVVADAQHLKLDRPKAADQFLIAAALGRAVLRHTIGDIGVFRKDIHL